MAEMKAGLDFIRKFYLTSRLTKLHRNAALAVVKDHIGAFCEGAHINNVALGRHGRHRTNVWDYVSQNTLNGTSRSKLALHPTVKPVAMVADAIRDCSNRNAVILDPFGGAGTTLIAAE